MFLYIRGAMLELRDKRGARECFFECDYLVKFIYLFIHLFFCKRRQLRFDPNACIFASRVWFCMNKNRKRNAKFGIIFWQLNCAEHAKENINAIYIYNIHTHRHKSISRMGVGGLKFPPPPLNTFNVMFLKLNS